MAKERPSPTLVTADVVRTEWLTPHMIRVVLGGPGVADYQHNAFTDRYVKLVFPRPGVDWTEPLDLPAMRRDLPPEQRPRLRTYTVRGYDAEAGELWIDFVFHGHEGVAGPWAAGARPGDRLHLLGPSGAYAPDPTADWHLFIGDEAALPAIASAVEVLPDGAHVVAVIEVADADEAAYAPIFSGAEVRWLLRDAGDPGLLEAAMELELPPGDGQAFVHGELSIMRQLRSHLLDGCGLAPERLSLSGYWRRGKDEEGFQAEKAEESRQAAAT